MRLGTMRATLTACLLVMGMCLSVVGANADGVPPVAPVTMPGPAAQPIISSSSTSYAQVVHTAAGFVALDAAGNAFAFDDSGGAVWSRSGLFPSKGREWVGGSMHARASSDGKRLMVAAGRGGSHISVHLLDSATGQTVWHTPGTRPVGRFGEAIGNVGDLAMGPGSFAVRKGRKVTLVSLATGAPIRRVRIPRIKGTQSEVALDESTGYLVLYNGPISGKRRTLLRLTVVTDQGKRAWSKTWKGKPFRGKFEGSHWDNWSPQGWLNLVGGGKVVVTFGPWFKRGADGLRAYDEKSGRRVWKSSKVFAQGGRGLDAPFSWAYLHKPAHGETRKQYGALFDEHGKLRTFYTGCTGYLFGSGDGPAKALLVGSRWYVAWEHSCLMKSRKTWRRLIVVDVTARKVVGSYPVVKGGLGDYAGPGLAPVSQGTYGDTDFYLTPQGVVLRTVAPGDGEVTSTGATGLLGPAELSLYPYGASTAAWTMTPAEWANGATAFAVGQGALSLWRAGSGETAPGLTLYK